MSENGISRSAEDASRRLSELSPVAGNLLTLAALQGHQLNIPLTALALDMNSSDELVAPMKELEEKGFLQSGDMSFETLSLVSDVVGNPGRLQQAQQALQNAEVRYGMQQRRQLLSFDASRLLRLATRDPSTLTVDVDAAVAAMNLDISAAAALVVELAQAGIITTHGFQLTDPAFRSEVRKGVHWRDLQDEEALLMQMSRQTMPHPNATLDPAQWR